MEERKHRIGKHKLEVEETLGSGFVEPRPRCPKAQVWAPPTMAQSAFGKQA